MLEICFVTVAPIVRRPLARARRLPAGWQQRLAVLAGGLCGSAVRVGLEQAWQSAPDAWPWPTFVVNLAGALALGLLFPRLLAAARPAGLGVPLLAVGLLGALTTFSLFLFEAWLLVERGRAGLAAAYVALTIAGGLALAVAGDRLAAVWR